MQILKKRKEKGKRLLSLGWEGVQHLQIENTGSVVPWMTAQKEFFNFFYYETFIPLSVLTDRFRLSEFHCHILFISGPSELCLASSSHLLSGGLRNLALEAVERAQRTTWISVCSQGNANEPSYSKFSTFHIHYFLLSNTSCLNLPFFLLLPNFTLTLVLGWVLFAQLHGLFTWAVGSPIRPSVKNTE